MSSSESMVLRTIYLPVRLDEQLRVAAFTARKSKGEIMREALSEAMDKRHAISSEPESRPVATLPAETLLGVEVSTESSFS